MVLDTEPVGDVTVTIGGIADTELTLDKTALTFTTGNWDTEQTVRVTADQDDDAVDEDVVNITHTVSSTADTQYDGVTAGSVAVTVTDDDTPAPDFTLTMEPPTHGDTDVDGKVNLGDTLRYTAVATNTGNVPLENVNVKDALINTSGTDCAESAHRRDLHLHGHLHDRPGGRGQRARLPTPPRPRRMESRTRP